MLLVVPNLTKKCVLGVDTLRPLGGIINLEDDTLTLHHEGESQILSMYEETTEKPKTQTISHLW